MIGKKINFFRLQKAMTKTEFAKVIGVSVSTIWRYENNKSKISNMDILKKITSALDIKLVDLLSSGIIKKSYYYINNRVFLRYQLYICPYTSKFLGLD